MAPRILTTPDEVRSFTASVRAAGQRLALVPTMGYLHAGHAALFDAAGKDGAVVAASIFVNPLQFGPSEDLSRYPRDLERDLALCARHQVHAVYTPSVEAMYPAGFSTTVTVDRLTVDLEGGSRPGHFAGVATVVTKLFGLFRPDVAVFGEKDYQQLQVVKRLARDLELGVDVQGEPTVRERDGLALSSRNVYLSAELRAEAGIIPVALREAQAAVKAGERDAKRVEAQVKARVEGSGALRVDYAAVREPHTLAPVEVLEPGRPGRLLVAVFAGTTRLLDNVALEPG